MAPNKAKTKQKQRTKRKNAGKKRTHNNTSDFQYWQKFFAGSLSVVRQIVVRFYESIYEWSVRIVALIAIYLMLS